MKLFAITALLALSACGLSPEPLLQPDGALVIANDDGGWVEDYVKHMLTLRKTGQKVRLEGLIASSATVYLHLGPEQVCLDRKATFGFHGTSPKDPDPEMQEYYDYHGLAQFYPEPIRSIYMQKWRFAIMHFEKAEALAAMAPGKIRICD